MIVAMKHEKRRFVADVDFITSPGWIKGRRTRAERRAAAGRHVARRHRPGHPGLRRGEPRDEGAGPAARASRASRCRTTPASSCCSTEGLETAEPPRKDELAMLRQPRPGAAVYGVTSMSRCHRPLSPDAGGSRVEVDASKRRALGMPWLAARPGGRALSGMTVRNSHGPEESRPCSASPCATSPSIRRCRARRR